MDVAKNMTRDLQFLSNQNTAKSCPLRYLCKSPHSLLVLCQCERPTFSRLQKDALIQPKTPIHIFPSAAAWSLRGRCRHQRARTHAQPNWPASSRVGAAEPQSLMLTRHLPESTHTLGFPPHLSLHKPPPPPGRTSPRVCGCVCVFYVWSIKRGPEAQHPEHRGLLFRNGN